MTIHFGTGARAFGARLTSNGQGPTSEPYYSRFTATISTDTGESYRFDAPAVPGWSFFGVISTTSMTNLTFSDGGPFPTPSPNSMHEECVDMVQAVVNSVPLPSLRLIVQPEFQIATLQWPVTNAGFVLQQAADPDSTNWVTLVEPPGPPFAGPFRFVQVPYPSGRMFYRLVLNQWH
jgi:hypothetical protein